MRDAEDVAQKVANNFGDMTSGALLIVLDACRDNPLMDDLASIGKIRVSAPQRVKIPHANAELRSLNLSTAAGIATYEAWRQVGGG